MTGFFVFNDDNFVFNMIMKNVIQYIILLNIYIFSQNIYA